MEYTPIADLFTTTDNGLNDTSIAASHSYSKTQFPFNLQIIEERLNEKLRLNPDYEVFVPLYYCQLERLKRDSSVGPNISPAGIYISNRGNVLSDRSGEVKPLQTSTGPEGDIIFHLTNGKHEHTLTLARAMACSFLALTPELVERGLHPKDLEVQHINGNKLDTALANLRWAHPEDSEQAPAPTKAKATTDGKKGGNKSPRAAQLEKGHAAKGKGKSPAKESTALSADLVAEVVGKLEDAPLEGKEIAEVVVTVVEPVIAEQPTSPAPRQEPKTQPITVHMPGSTPDI